MVFAVVLGCWLYCAVVVLRGCRPRCEKKLWAPTVMTYVRGSGEILRQKILNLGWSLKWHFLHFESTFEQNLKTTNHFFCSVCIHYFKENNTDNSTTNKRRQFADNNCLLYCIVMTPRPLGPLGPWAPVRRTRSAASGTVSCPVFSCHVVQCCRLYCVTSILLDSTYVCILVVHSLVCICKLQAQHTVLHSDKEGNNLLERINRTFR